MANIQFVLQGNSPDDLIVDSVFDVEILGSTEDKSILIEPGASAVGIDAGSSVKLEGVSKDWVFLVRDGTTLKVLSYAGDILLQIAASTQLVSTIEFAEGVAELRVDENFNVAIGNVSLANDEGVFAGHGFELAPMLDSDIESALSHSVINTSTSSWAAEALAAYPSLIGDSAWQQDSIGYGYPSVRPLDHNAVSGWRPLNSLEQSLFEGVVERQNTYLAADLVSSNDPDVRVVAAQLGQGTAGYAYFPGDGIGGDTFISASNSVGEAEGHYFSKSLMAHELGHAMGLKHPFEDAPILESALDNYYYSIMSYTRVGHWKVEANDLGGGYYEFFTTDKAYRTDLGMIDIAALQSLYGADMSTNQDDTVYTYAEASRSFDHADGLYLTIWDAGGLDTIDASDAQYTCTIDLGDFSLSSVSERSVAQETLNIIDDAGLSSWAFDDISNFISGLGEGAFLNQNNLSIAAGVVIENVLTGAADDTVFDNFVDNSIITGAGNDTIFLGRGGFDEINAGTGNDTVALSLAQAQVDVVHDASGVYLVAEDFAAHLIGVETLLFSDAALAIA